LVFGKSTGRVELSVETGLIRDQTLAPDQKPD